MRSPQTEAKLTARAATADDHPLFARLFAELGVHDPVPDREQFARGADVVHEIVQMGGPVAVPSTRPGEA
jgi:hypothetical protein